MIALRLFMGFQMLMYGVMCAFNPSELRAAYWFDESGWKWWVALLMIGGPGGGRYIVTLVGGGTVEVRSGTVYATGTKVFVVGKTIEGVAPTLTASIIDV